MNKFEALLPIFLVISLIIGIAVFTYGFMYIEQFVWLLLSYILGVISTLCVLMLN